MDRAFSNRVIDTSTLPIVEGEELV
jgi:hypothetical protein